MTCKDCIHYKSISALCGKYIYPEERNNEPCRLYEDFDGLLYVTPKRKVVPVNLKVENIYKHKSDFSDIDDGFEEIEDSWESVSK